MIEVFYFNKERERVFIPEPFMTSEQAKELYEDIINNKDLFIDKGGSYSENTLGLLGQRVIAKETKYEEGRLEFEEGVGGIISYISTDPIESLDEDIYGFFVEFDDGNKSTLSISEFEIEVLDV
jgi:hypothetical protein